METVVRIEQIDWEPQYKTKSSSLSAYWRIAIKRCIDLVGAFVGLILLSPFMCLIALLIKINDPKGPVFYRQRRIGQYSRTFEIIKFRSMIHDAENHLKKTPHLYEKYVSNNYKLESDEDPRITRFGRFLRKTSLDELPQLVNVLTGDMSLVGPRPVVRQELKEYGYRSFQLLSVKPGITGYWQVSGRSNVGYPERVDLELYYVNNQSLLFDLKILLRTVWIVLLRRGAH
ncbi:sugar transferase [Cohnella sp. AR92]|nr:sugar transferase [Cohnella sp. AR92]RUS45378.1 sugar transferase [Cohnella sp. AR92]